jgi:uncharacterized membrane protein YkvA (DUF1232 family)
VRGSDAGNAKEEDHPEKTSAKSGGPKKTATRKSPKRDSARKSWGATAKDRIGRVRIVADEMLRDPKRLGNLADEAAQKTERRKGKIGEAIDSLRAFIHLIRAYADGSYRVIPIDTMVLITGAVLYFGIPVDAIPDFIPGVGYLDDAGVIAFVLYMVKDEGRRIHQVGTRQG